MFNSSLLERSLSRMEEMAHDPDLSDDARTDIQTAIAAMVHVRVHFDSFMDLAILVNQNPEFFPQHRPGLSVIRTAVNRLAAIIATQALNRSQEQRRRRSDTGPLSHRRLPVRSM